MTKKITMTNAEIYTLSELVKAVKDKVDEMVMPIRAGLFLKRNFARIINMARVIDEARTKIGNRYGTYNEKDNYFQIPDDKITEAQNELDSLMSIKQEFEIYTIPLDDLGDIKTKVSLIDAITFMIETE